MTACSQPKQKNLEPVIATSDSVVFYQDTIMTGSAKGDYQLIFAKETFTLYNRDNDSAIILVIDRGINQQTFSDGSFGFSFRTIHEDRYVYLGIIFDERSRLRSVSIGVPGACGVFIAKQEIENKNL